MPFYQRNAMSHLKRSLSCILATLLLGSALVACFKKPTFNEVSETTEETTVILVTDPVSQPSQSAVATTTQTTVAQTTPAPTDPPRTGKVYLYLTVNVVPSEQLGQVYVYVENQSNRQFRAKQPLELQELVNGAWQVVTTLPEHSNYTVQANELGQVILNLSTVDLKGGARQFRLYQKYELLNSKSEVDATEEVYSQNFTVHTQATLAEDEYISLGLDKTVFTQADLAQFNIHMENASSKYVMVYRNFSVQVYREGEWVDYPLQLEFGSDSWYINPQSRDKQSYNLRAAGLNPNEEAYRIVKPYGLFFTTDSSQQSESFYVFSEPFKIQP